MNMKGKIMERMTQKEVDKILENHKLWFSEILEFFPPNKHEGERANFRNRSLIGADFRGANLTLALFEGANLENANFEGAILTKAFFTSVNLKNANLTNTNIEGANFQNTHLEGCKGLIDPTEYLNKTFEKVDEGYIVYKTFGLLYPVPECWDVEEGSEIVENGINNDRRNACAPGVNVATKVWITRMMVDKTMWKCLIKNEDIKHIIVPYTTDGKIRCRKLTILEKVDYK